jgi:hypothetical protein
MRKAKAGTQAEPTQYHQALSSGWTELHQGALKDPAAYLAFLRAPGNEGICDGLLDILAMAPSFANHRFFMAEDLPTPILEGVADLLASGSKEQKAAAARFAADLLGNAPSDKRDILLEPCLALLSSDDPRARAAALDLLHWRRPDRLDQSLDQVNGLWNSSADPEVRHSCLSALAGMKSAAGEQLFYEKTSEYLRGHEGECLPLIQVRLARATPAEVDRCGEILLTALRGTTDQNAFQGIAAAALDLPLAKATPILQQAAASAPTPESRDRVRRVLDQIQSGEVRPDRLRTILQGSWR